MPIKNLPQLETAAAGAPEIEVLPEMIEVGVQTYYENASGAEADANPHSKKNERIGRSVVRCLVIGTDESSACEPDH